MTDPFRGEMTAKYVQQENLEWAARERLARQAAPRIDYRKSRWLGLEAHLLGLINRHRRPQPLARPRMAH